MPIYWCRFSGLLSDPGGWLVEQQSWGLSVWLIFSGRLKPVQRLNGHEKRGWIPGSQGDPVISPVGSKNGQAVGGGSLAQALQVCW